MTHVMTVQENRPRAAAQPVRWAADAVATMREGARVRLDYSAQSLWRVDRMIEEIRRDGAPYAAIESELRGFGAYAGEVIARQTGGEWWASGVSTGCVLRRGGCGTPSTRRGGVSAGTGRCGCCAGTR